MSGLRLISLKPTFSNLEVDPLVRQVRLTISYAGLGYSLDLKLKLSPELYNQCNLPALEALLGPEVLQRLSEASILTGSKPSNS